MKQSSRRWVSLGVCASTLAFASVAGAQESAPAAAPAQPASAVPASAPPQPATVGTTTTTASPVILAGEPVAHETRETHEEGYAPNPYLLTTGFILWGGTYTASVVTAAESGNSSDQHLYVPIVGPWIDLGARGGCPVSSNSCNRETGNKVLLALDGTVQAIGTVEVIWGFLKPMHRDVTTVRATRYTPPISIQPSHVANGYGIAAFARF